MHYSKKVLLCLFVFVICIQQVFAFYATKWKLVYTNSNYSVENEIAYVNIDIESVNIHNDSIYYAIQYGYSKGNRVVNQYVSIIQCKGNKAGIVETYNNYEYDNKIMQDHINYAHPAYVAKNAKALKELTPDSFMYKANETAKMIAEVKKTNPYEFLNGLYGI